MIQLYYGDFIKIFHFEIDHTLNNMGDLLEKILDILNIDSFSSENILFYNKQHDLIDFESNYLLIDNDYFDVVIDIEDIEDIDSYDPEINVDGDQPWD